MTRHANPRTVSSCEPGDVIQVLLGGSLARVQVRWLCRGGAMVALDPDRDSVRYHVRGEAEVLEVYRRQRDAQLEGHR
jgi:hypothetical protein